MGKQKTRIVFICGTHIMISLAIGLMLYVLLRPDALVTKICTSILGLSIQPTTIVLDVGPIVWIRNYLADYLWAYASAFGLIIIMCIYDNSIVCVFMLGIILDVIMEFLQIINPFFTFDLLDLLVEVLGTLFAFFVYVRFICSGGLTIRSQVKNENF